MNGVIKITWYLKKSFRILNKHISSVFSGKIKHAYLFNGTQLPVAKASFSFSNKNYCYQGKEPYWFKFKGIELNSLWFAKIKAIVVGRGILLNENNEVILESTIGQPEYLYKLESNHLIYGKLLLPSKKVNKAISLSNRLEHNYYHWILESIGRLIFIPSEELMQYSIIINSRSQKFVIDSLTELLEIPVSNIIYKKEFSKIEIEEALIPSFPITRNEESQMTNIYHPHIINKINEQSKKITKLAKRRNIIICRDNALERRIVNKELIKEAFPDLEFEVISLENLSFKNQMELFANAGIIVAIHGAGLVNIIFSNSPIIIEFFPTNRNRRDSFYFYQISQELQLEHYLIEYESVNEQQDLFIEDMHLEILREKLV